MENITLVNGDDQFVFNVIGENPEGFEFPSTRISIEDVAGDRSAVYINSKAGRRRLSWQAVIETADISQTRRDLVLVARPGNLKTLKFETCDGLELQTEVEIENVIMPYKIGRTKCLIEAVAPDWRFYSQELHEFETVQTVITGGLAIPAAIPYDMSGGEVVSSTTVLNDGNEVSDPIFTIQGPGTSFTIGNQTTGGELVIDYELTSDDSIVIDVKNRTIILNGDTSIYSALASGDFWSLAPGANIMRFIVTGADVDTLLTVNWRDAIIGI